MPYLGVLSKIVQENYCPILNHHYEIWLSPKFKKKKEKSLNLVPKMSYLSMFGLEF